MQKIEMIRPDIFVIRLGDEIPEIKQEKKFSCFFIVNRMNDKEYIKSLAKRLLRAGCREFSFYGTENSIWHCTVDEEDKELVHDEEDAVYTFSVKVMDGFLEELHLDISLIYCDYVDRYLFYDDETLYRKVIEKLNEMPLEE